MQYSIFSTNKTLVRPIYVRPYATGSDMVRIIFEIRATEPPTELNKLIKAYEVWVLRDVVEDKYHLKQEANDSDMLRFAKEFLETRYHDSSNQVPSEGGAYIVSSTNIILGNPNTFQYKLPEDQRQKKRMTSIMLPEDTLGWLKEYSLQKKISVGESIRQAVMDFQAGTARLERSKSFQNSSGAANTDLITNESINRQEQK